MTALGRRGFVWVCFVRGKLPERNPEVVHPTAQVGPVVAASAPSPGPWRASANGVVLTVATIDYEEDHLAQVRFRLKNRSQEVVVSKGDPKAYIRGGQLWGGRIASGSSLPNSLVLGPGQSTFGRIALGRTWATNTESFEVRLVLTYEGNTQYLTLTSPGCL